MNLPRRTSATAHVAVPVPVRVLPYGGEATGIARASVHLGGQSILVTRADLSEYEPSITFVARIAALTHDGPSARFLTPSIHSAASESLHHDRRESV